MLTSLILSPELNLKLRWSVDDDEKVTMLIMGVDKSNLPWIVQTLDGINHFVIKTIYEEKFEPIVKEYNGYYKITTVSWMPMENGFLVELESTTASTTES